MRCTSPADSAISVGVAPASLGSTHNPGLSEVPNAGDRFYVVENLARAKAIAEDRSREQREESLAEKQTLSLADLFQQVDPGDPLVRYEVIDEHHAGRDRLDSRRS